MKSICWGRHRTALLATFMLTGTLAAQDRKPAEWTPVQLMQRKRVSGVQVSPDGKRVVYAVRQAVMDGGKSEYLTHIYLANADGSGTIQLTQGDKSCDDPQWSPNGRWIAFVSARGGKRNLWVMPSAGGEAVQVSDVPTAVTSFKWLPTSDHISYTALSAPAGTEQKAKDKNDARVVDEKVKMSVLYVIGVDRARPPKSDAETWTSPKLTSVSGTGRGGYDWAPDGRKLVLSFTNSPSPDDWTTARLSILHAPNSSLLSLTGQPARRNSRPCGPPTVSGLPMWRATIRRGGPAAVGFTSCLRRAASPNRSPRLTTTGAVSRSSSVGPPTARASTTPKCSGPERESAA